MRHNRDDKRFSRPSGHLRCMLSNLTNDLLSNGKIRTTTAKAKMLRRYAERMITLGKSGDLSSRRRAMAFLRNKITVTALFNAIGPGYKERNGGYTRMLKVGVRPGDCSPMSIIELVEGVGAKAEEAKKKGKSSAKGKPSKVVKAPKALKAGKTSKKSVSAQKKEKE
ncbi:MAG: 50S ribosomal protein L17 [Deltaproteobacteria bacterium]|nr:50S ribosomal protein L17 [Deltaproteobacteria bacterium]